MTKLFAVALLHVFLAAPYARAADGVPLRESVPHIVTTGRATLEVVPDLADIRLGVTAERPTADDATKIVAQSATDVIASIKTRRVEASDIKTGFSVSAFVVISTSASAKRM